VVNEKLLEQLLYDEMNFIEEAVDEEGFRGEEKAEEFDKRAQQIFKEIKEIVDRYERGFIG